MNSSQVELGSAAASMITCVPPFSILNITHRYYTAGKRMHVSPERNLPEAMFGCTLPVYRRSTAEAAQVSPGGQQESGELIAHASIALLCRKCKTGLASKSDAESATDRVANSHT